MIGAVCQFHCYLALHVQAICMGGVFDRFPRAQIIVGHLGENLVRTPLQILLTALAISSLESRSSCWKIWKKTRCGDEKDD